MAQMGVTEPTEVPIEGQPDIVAEGVDNPNLIEEIKDIEEVKHGYVVEEQDGDEEDKHPEKRMKAAFKNYEEERLKELR